MSAAPLSRTGPSRIHAATGADHLIPVGIPPARMPSGSAFVHAPVLIGNNGDVK